jgi:23S rRNA (adenine2503-C2)-methyltransferase
MATATQDIVGADPAPIRAGERKNLIGLSRAQLVAELAIHGLPAFRADQIWHWMYFRGVRSFDEMTTLTKPLRAELERHYVVARPETLVHQLSSDGTRKWVLGFADGNRAETVHIPEKDRGAVCVSSQVGCTLTCRFCHTGTQRLVRDLTAGEIVGQLMVARDAYGEWPSPVEGRLVSNIVMMGMGEPLYNYDNVVTALRIVMDEKGINIGRRRITLSTSGVVPRVKDVGRDLGVKLAISLHAVTDELRDRLVPLNRRYPIAELIAACRDYPGSRNSRRITFEYVMLKGVNDSPADARALVRLLRGVSAKVNLIPFNAWPGAPFECSTDAAIKTFADIVNDAGYSSPVRTPRGRDILAACGQLKTESERLPRRLRPAGEEAAVAP